MEYTEEKETLKTDVWEKFYMKSQNHVKNENATQTQFLSEISSIQKYDSIVSITYFLKKKKKGKKKLWKNPTLISFSLLVTSTAK